MLMQPAYCRWSEFVCSFCRAKKDVVLPEYHFVDHRIEILNHDKDYNNVVVYENAVARPQAFTLPSRAK